MATFNNVDYSEGSLAELSLKQLGELYNQLAETPIKAFKDKPTGIKRVWEKLQALPTTTKKRSRNRFQDSDVIRILVAENPKRQNTKAHAKFAAIKDGMTIAQLRALEGKGLEPDLDEEPGWPFIELRYCLNKGLAKIEAA
jgi:hypothetical protein